MTGSRPVRIPAGRGARLARFGTLATGIAGNVALRAAGELGRGTRPDLRRLLLTPDNVRRLTGELARMRGAAMKIGQLLSMDAGEVLPPELAEILARLRADADFMPPKQLRRVLDANWGRDWLRQFSRFDVRPVAAASIGQVHRATLRDGRELAVKVQYPGVAGSIDSDVSNVGALVRLSGLFPRDFDLAPYLDEARRQLREETDYMREGTCLAAFGARLEGDERFVVPELHEDWSTPEVLAMSFVEGRPIEAAAGADAETRNRIAGDLIDLFLVELLDWAEMQSDPNFANYRLAEDGRIVLLDFGATRGLDRALIRRYRALMRAGLAGDHAAVETEAAGIGLLSGNERPGHRQRILAMIAEVFGALRDAGSFDFADETLSRKLQAEGTALAEDGYLPPPLPMDVLYLQRKIGGLYLLARRLGARLPIGEMLADRLGN